MRKSSTRNDRCRLEFATEAIMSPTWIYCGNLPTRRQVTNLPPHFSPQRIIVGIVRKGDKERVGMHRTCPSPKAVLTTYPAGFARRATSPDLLVSADEKASVSARSTGT